jgi:GNAT superfamily N-acetyltransferase
LIVSQFSASLHEQRPSEMTIEIIQEELDHLPAHGRISIAFEVRSILELTVANAGLGGFVFRERKLAASYMKDYDSGGESRPDNWSRCFDITNWVLHSAWIEGRRVGGLVTAFRTEGLDMLEQRDDLAVIWDLRVSPALRGRGVGAALFAAAEAWAKAQACKHLKVETQNVNVPACRFYARLRCTLGSIHRFAYPQLPEEEVQLLWYKNI